MSTSPRRPGGVLNRDAGQPPSAPGRELVAHDYEASVGSVMDRIAPWALAQSATVEGRAR
jgi:hypothetical protein